MRFAFIFISSLLFSLQSFSQSNNFEKLDAYLKETTRSDKWYSDVRYELKKVQFYDLKRTLVYIDKILKTSNLEGDDLSKVNLLFLKAETLYQSGEYPSAFNILQQLKADLGNKVNSEKFAKYWLLLGYYYAGKGKNDSLKYCVNKLEGVYKAPDPDYYSYLIAASYVFGNESNLAAATRNLLEAARYYELEGHRAALASVYNNLAGNFKNLNNYADAIKYYNLAIGLFKKDNVKLDVGRGFSNLGAVYSALKNYDKALLYYDSGYAIAVQLNNPLSIAQNLTNKGNIYEKQGRYQESKLAFTKCLEIATQFGIEYGRLLSFINLGNTSRLLKDYQHAELYLNQALGLAQQMKLVSLELEVYREQAQLYEDMDSFQKAYTLLHKFHTMEDSLNTEKIKKETIALKEKYESEKKSNEINILKTEGLKNQIIILALGLLALALIIFIQWNSNKNKQAKLKLADEEKERKYLKKIVESREKELTAQIAQIVQLEDDIKTMHEELVSIIDNSSEGVEKLKHQLKSQLIDKNEFVKINEGFEDRITEFNQDYFKLLLSKYPELTLAELKLCAYLRLGLSTKEIAQLLNRSIRTIESSRTDIRKKIKLASEENLTTHLIALTD